MNMVSTLILTEALNSLKLPGLHKNLFSSQDWLEVLQKTYGLKLFVKYIKHGGKINSYIIYSVVTNFLEWKICICSYCDYFDCHVESLEDWRLFFKSLQKDYPGYRIAVRNLDDEIIRKSPDFEVLSTERFHMLDVREPLEVIWKRTDDSFRSAVKQGQKKGVVAKRCEKKELKKFFELHFSLRKNKYRLFAQPYKFFDMIWQQYIDKDQGALIGVYSPDGKFIGANMYLICGNKLYYKFNTSSRDSLKFRPNNVLFWEGIKFAKERNLEYIDLGSSGCHQSGLILFKNHTGAVMSDITHLGYAPEGYKFSEKKILKFMTKVCTLPWMPDIITKLLSNIIYHYLA